MTIRLLFVAACLAVSAHVYAQNISPSTLPVLVPTTSVPGSATTPGDFNGDGASDLLLYNPLASSVSFWFLAPDSAGGVKRTGTHTVSIAPGYYVAAIGDFNGDGVADVVFTSAKRDLYLWTNSGTGSFLSTKLISYPTGWQLLGAGDVDGDGKSDLLWLNASACEFAYWTMDGPVRTGYGIEPIPCGDTPIGIGYFNPSNRLSILWSNAAHQLSIWDSNGNGFSKYSLGSYTAGNHLMVAGGGSAGQMLMIESGVQTDPYFGSGSFSQHAITRTFDTQGNQTAYTDNGGLSGGTTFPVSTAGFFIARGGANQTGVIYQFSNDILLACSADGRSETNYVPDATQNVYNNYPAGCTPFPLDRGWYVMGAIANGFQQEAGQ